MSKVLGFFKKNRTLTIVAAAVLVVVLLVVIFNPGANANANVVFPDVYTLTRMDLEKLVPAKGNVESVTSRSVTASSMSTVAEINVKEGDYVEKDTTLAKLDTTEIDRQISDLNTSISNASSKVSDAESALNTAKSNYNTERTKQLAPITAALEAAKASAKADCADEKTAMENAEFAYNADTSNAALKAAYDAAKLAYETKYNSLIATAQATYDAAVAAMEASLAPLSAAVQTAQATLDTLKESRKTLNTQMDSLQRTRGDYYIKAPIAGTVTSVGATVGVAPSSISPMFTIEDLTKLQIKVPVPEYDILSVKLGQEVNITSDSDSKASWKGVVSAISPVATDLDHNFTVTIEITSALGNLTAGMSAKANIICEKKAAVFAVPYDAVVTNSSGQQVIYAVERLEGNETGNKTTTNNAVMYDTENRKEIVVSTGMESDYYIEIISTQLFEGMYIISDPENRNVSTGGGGIFAFGM